LEINQHPSMSKNSFFIVIVVILCVTLVCYGDNIETTLRKFKNWGNFSSRKR
jgi:hypothetical protein